MKDGFDFSLKAIRNDWGITEEYEATLKETQIDGHVVIIQSVGLESQEAIAGIIVYLDTRIKELVDFKATLKRMIKEDKECQ